MIAGEVMVFYWSNYLNEFRFRSRSERRSMVVDKEIMLFC